MTLIIGILCSDGVVMASDSCATYADGGNNPTIGQQECRKVVGIGSSALYSSTGSVGISQLLTDKIKNTLASGDFTKQTELPPAMNLLGDAIRKTVAPYFETSKTALPLIGPNQGVLCKSLLATCVGSRFGLFQFDFVGVPEHATKELPFISLGSGQGIADPFLAFLKRVLWTDREPTLAEGRFVAAWTIRHAEKTNPGGVGGPLQLATLFRNPRGAGFQTKIESDDLQGHYQAIEDAEKALLDHVLKKSGDTPPPPVPEPEAAARPVAPVAGAAAAQK